MRGLGSALADHAVGALQAQGLMQGKSLTEAVSPPHSALMCLIKWWGRVSLPLLLLNKLICSRQHESSLKILGCCPPLKGTKWHSLLLPIFYSPIIHLKALNRFIPHVHFKMEGIQSLRELILPGDFMIKLDLKDAYFSIPIHTTQQRFLSFMWEGQSYQFTCLPFGFSSAPRTFTKGNEAVSYLRSLGIQLWSSWTTCWRNFKKGKAEVMLGSLQNETCAAKD